MIVVTYVVIYYYIYRAKGGERLSKKLGALYISDKYSL